MREPDQCPACEGQAGRVDRAEIAGTPVSVYWHTDLADEKECCLEYPSGETEQWHFYSVDSGRIAAD